MMQTSELKTGELIDGKYRIDRPLGSGGMGAVYLATHVGTERPVALKVIASQFMMNEEFVARFQREARAAGRLRHPNVVDVTDFGFAQAGTGRIAYLVMEYLDGCTLDEVLAEESRLPLGWVVDIIEQVCSAVDEAHQQGIIHRDLKPDNIWLEPNRRGGFTAKVLDFGLAKLTDQTKSVIANGDDTALSPHPPSTISLPSAITLNLPGQEPPSEAKTQILPGRESVAATAGDESETRLFPSAHTTNDAVISSTAPADGLTRVGSVMGTPAYMSPEQCLSQPLNSRSDIYSLGVIAFQMLAGRTPFTGDALSVMRQHIESPPPRLRDLRHDVPKKVARQISLALSKNPADRPVSAAAFASALRASAQRPGNLIRQSITLLSEQHRVFIRLALVIFAPLIMLTLLRSASEWLTILQLIPRTPGLVLTAVTTFLLGIFTHVTATVHLAVAARLVTQMLAAPLRPVRLRPALKSLGQRLWPFITTNLRSYIRIGLGLVCFVIPGLIAIFHYHLLPPVVMIEGLKGKAALRRSRELARRARRMVIFVLIVQMIIPAVSGSVLSYLTQAVLKDLAVSEVTETLARILPIVNIPLHLLLVTISSVLSSLLYLTTRQAGGETLKQTLGLFEEEELPASQWQRRMRQRLSASSSTRSQ